VSCLSKKMVAAQVQPAAGDADATRRRQSLQWGDADEGSGFPGRMPEHDAEDDYEELLQVGQINKREKWGYADTLGTGPAIEQAAMAKMSASVVSSLHDGQSKAVCIRRQQWIRLAGVNRRRHGSRWTRTCVPARRC
jgi:hypothetical protein